MPERSGHSGSGSAAVRHAPRVGLIVPSTNTVFEPELQHLLRPHAAVYTARVGMEAGANLDTRAGFAAVMDGIDRALPSVGETLQPIAPRHVVFGTSARTFWGGVAGARAFEDRLRAVLPGVTVSTASAATAAALARCGATRVAVLTPYDFAVDEIAAWLQETGHEVVARHVLGMSVPSDMAAFSDGHVVGALRSLAATGAEAVLQVGTNMWFADLAGEASRWLGIPVLGVNTLLAWDTLRQLDVPTAVLGGAVPPALH